MADNHANFAYSTIITAPSPATSGTSLTVASGDGVLFPSPPFNATIWPASAQPTTTNAEIVRVTNITGDTFTIIRQQENTRARTIQSGDQIAATITKKTLTDAEKVIDIYSPFILASAGTGVQTLASASAQTGTGSLLVFPVTITNNLAFNHIILINQLSYVTSSTTGTVANTYISKFGLYSLTGNTLSLITSNSFSINETWSGGTGASSMSLSWFYPTSTFSNGYNYGSFPFNVEITTSGQISSYISGSRNIALNFNKPIHLDPGMYWIGIMSQRSTAGSSNVGLSNVGIVGQIINQINSVGSVSGLLPIGFAGSQWTSINTHTTGWFGRHIIGFVTATSITNQLGTAVPSAITISALGAVAASSTVSILPTVSFVSES